MGVWTGLKWLWIGSVGQDVVTFGFHTRPEISYGLIVRNPLWHYAL
jgi:hypothetical protein